MKRVSGSGKLTGKKSGTIRIIAGQWRGRKLPVKDMEGLRPTTDRNKETLFNWLMHDISGARCLDMFAGAGSLGFEALSRWAESCVFIEKNNVAASQLYANCTLLNANATVKEGDALSVVSSLNQQFDVVFVDPPFHSGLIQPALNALTNSGALAPQAKIYIEHEATAGEITLPDGAVVAKEKRLSQLHYYLVQLP